MSAPVLPCSFQCADQDRRLVLSNLAGKVAVVTGGAGGLGAGVAHSLSAAGAVVVCADLRDASGIVAKLPGMAGSKAVLLDVTIPEEVDRLFDGLIAEYGRLDILVNAAGVAQPPVPLTVTDNEVIDRVLEINVKGVLYCSRAAARLMGPAGSGRIITISSQAGKVGWANWAVYCASKAAVIAATQALALELAGRGVTANCICPGAMLTDMTRASFRAEADQTGADPEQMLRERGLALPAGRLGTPEDVGYMAAWLASDESSFTTGATLNLTGGESVFF
jgi:NAD(P)-dependent dehydrogenase (short-subunit alcohol dehydrogenase family)